eukprot:jgi/Mesvir1/5010/Mv13896-RA.3
MRAVSRRFWRLWQSSLASAANSYKAPAANGGDIRRMSSKAGESLGGTEVRRSGWFGKSLLGLGLGASALVVGKALFDELTPVTALRVTEKCPPHKQRIVVLGSGWGATSFLSHLSTQARELFEVVVVSPQNYFLFTPLLPSAAVGTVEPRSLGDPMHILCARQGDGFVEAAAVDVVPSVPGDGSNRGGIVTCRSEDGRAFNLEYDHVLVAVGSINNDFKTPGVKEHARFLKTIQDARAIRQEVIRLFECAAVPNVPEADIARMLHFVIVGGGPTGTEAAAELHDFIHEDLLRVFPQLRKFVRISLLQSSSHILNTYDMRISEYAEARFERAGIDVVTNARVTGIGPGRVDIQPPAGRDAPAQAVSLNCGLAIWATGNSPPPLVRTLGSRLTGQEAKKGLVVDDCMRVVGGESKGGSAQGRLWGIGDACVVDLPQLKAACQQAFEDAVTEDSTKGQQGLTYQQFQAVAEATVKQHPLLEAHFARLDELFAIHDKNGDKVLSVDELQAMVAHIDRNMRPFPATAQVASQQGMYVADIFNHAAKAKAHMPAPRAHDGVPDIPVVPHCPFRYKHLGSFVYVGRHSSVLDLGHGLSSAGLGVFWLGAPPF